MQGGWLYVVIVGGLCVFCTLFVVGTIAALYIADKWSKRNDPGAPGFLELNRRDQTKEPPQPPEKTPD